MNHLKKLLVVLVAAMMVINSLSLSVFAYKEGTTPKFQASISSTASDGQTTTVEGTVYDDYGMELVLPNTKVNASNAEVKIKLTNVASLGGIDREASMRLTTGSTAEMSVYEIMKIIGQDEEALFAFKDANVHAVVKTAEESKEVSYQFAGSDFDGKANSVKTVTGTADTEAARAAWMLLVEQIETGTTDDEDSYISSSFSLIGIYIETPYTRRRIIDPDKYKLISGIDLNKLISNIHSSSGYRKAYQFLCAESRRNPLYPLSSWRLYRYRKCIRRFSPQF